MLADFLTVIPHRASMVLITSRPEYEGALTRVHGAQTIALAPLADSDTAALIGELLGRIPRSASWRLSSPSRPPIVQQLGGRFAGLFFSGASTNPVWYRYWVSSLRGVQRLHSPVVVSRNQIRDTRAHRPARSVRTRRLAASCIRLSR